MRRRCVATLLALMLALSGSLKAQVAPHGTCSSLPAGSFGSPSIPTSEVMLGGSFGSIFALAISSSYSSPAVTSDGHCTFYASSGNGVGGPAGSATWQLNYSLSGSQAGTFFYGLDPDQAFGNSLASLVYFPLQFGASGSVNLGSLGLSSFDPNVSGEYTLAIIQQDAFGNTMDYGAVNLITDPFRPDVPNVVPEPATYAMLAPGLLLIGGVIKIRRRKEIL